MHNPPSKSEVRECVSNYRKSIGYPFEIDVTSCHISRGESLNIEMSSSPDFMLEEIRVGTTIPTEYIDGWGEYIREGVDALYKEYLDDSNYVLNYKDIDYMIYEYGHSVIEVNRVEVLCPHCNHIESQDHCGNLSSIEVDLVELYLIGSMDCDCAESFETFK